MEKKTRHINLEFKFAPDSEYKLIGYGSKYGNIDFAGDIIEKGAFKKSINDMSNAKNKFPFLYQHDQTQPIGVIDVIKEDENGLYIEVELNPDVQRAREAYSLAKQGALKGFSVGFNIEKQDFDKKGIRMIKEARLWEVSLVTFPCNEQATVNSIKAQFEEETPEEVVDEPKQTPEELLNALKALTESDELPEGLSKEDWVFLVENLVSLWNASVVTANDDNADESADVGADADADATQTEAGTSAEAQDEEAAITEDDIKKWMALYR